MFLDMNYYRDKYITENRAIKVNKKKKQVIMVCKDDGFVFDDYYDITQLKAWTL